MRVFTKVQGGIGKVELKEVAILLINTVSFSLGYSVIAHSILRNIMDIKSNFIMLFVVLFCTYMTVSIVFVFAGIPCMAFVLCIYLCVHKITFIKSATCCIFNTIIIIIVMICLNIVGTLLGMTSAQMVGLRETFLYNLYSSIVYIILSFLCACIIKYIGVNFPKINNMIGKIENGNFNRISYILLLNIIFVLLIICATEFAVVLVDSSVTKYIVIFGNLLSGIFIAFSIISMILSIKTVNNEIERANLQKDKEITEVYKNEIKHMYDSVRDFKHDYMKIYSSMSMLIERGDIDGLRDFFNNEIVPLQNDILNETDTAHEITKISDSIIQGTVYNYIIKAKNKGIEPVINIDGDVPNTVSVTSVELARILGIILDNAIEAVCGIKDGTRKAVILGVYADKEHVTYIVKNTYSVQPDLSKIFDNDYSTKGGEHGRGLAIVKRITDKYDDVFLNVKLEKEYFVTELNLQIV